MNLPHFNTWDAFITHLETKYHLVDSHQVWEVLEQDYPNGVQIGNITTISNKPQQIGGQHVGIMDRTIIVENKELGVKIEMNAYNSQHKNREMATLLLDLIIEDLTKHI